jgi:exonuclease SbcC
MDVLDQLQEHGRMVGVVSHVGELRQRLPRQVHVEAGRSGSSVRVHAG